MGCFDTIKIKIKCPACKEKSLKEVQTKELDCNLNTYYKGDDIFTNKYNYLEGTATCSSKECLVKHFRVIVYIKRGIVTGKYKIKHNEESY